MKSPRTSRLANSWLILALGASLFVGCGGAADEDDLFSTAASGAGAAGISGAGGASQTGGAGGSAQGGQGGTSPGGKGGANQGGKGGTNQGGKGGTSQGGKGGTSQGGKGGTSQGGKGGATTGGSAGQPGQGGAAGDPGQGGAAGDPGQGGAAGDPGQGGAAGDPGQGGAAGDPGQGGAAGDPGQGGAAGDPGQGGAAGDPGQGGAAGDPGQGGAAGDPGQGGAAGDPGQGGAAGDPGQGGAAGDPGQGGAGGAPANPDVCPGEPVTLIDGTVAISGNTASLGNNFNWGDNQCGGSNSNDAVYAVTAPASGYLSIELTSDFSGSLYLRRICDDSNSRVTCDAGGNNNQITVQVLAGASFFVFVDGFGGGNEAGSYNLSMSFTPSVCGDGTTDPGEACDDGNGAAGDGCDKCQFEPACSFAETPDNSPTNPQKAPAGCSTVNYFPAAISSDGDHDWYCVQAQEGQTIVAETYNGNPGTCSKTPNDTIAEIFKGVPAQNNTNNQCFFGSTALECDDNSGPSNCSLLTYQVPAGQGGEYCIHVTKRAFSPNIPEYGVVISVQ